MKGIYSVAINGRKWKSGYAAYNKDYICDLKQCDFCLHLHQEKIKYKMKKSKFTE